MSIAEALPQEWPLAGEDVPWDEVQGLLAAADLADGLPMVPPTAARLAAMLDGVRDPQREIGHQPPLFGQLTPATVAYQCVLAGCVPGALPVLLAAAEASLADELNLLGLATTTGGAAVGMIVHGPAVASLGTNASTNCLGPGNRANATLGRALALVLRNVGGAKAGSGDMATVGQPAKYTLCLPESGGGGMPPLHARRGLDGRASGVTVLGISGTQEILPRVDAGSPEDILAPVAEAMRTTFRVSGAAKQPEAPEQLFVLPPELAGRIHDHGWDLGRIQAWLFEASRDGERPVAPSAGDIHPIVTGGPGVKMVYLPLWGGGTKPVTRAVQGG